MQRLFRRLTAIALPLWLAACAGQNGAFVQTPVEAGESKGFPTALLASPQALTPRIQPSYSFDQRSVEVINIDRQRVSDLQQPERDLWDRIRRGFAIPDLNDTLVDERTQWYSGRQDYVERMITRSSRYLYHIVAEVEKRGMPSELALLPFIESAYNPQATSVAKAAGIWQFMPSTGRFFNLKQNLFRDERRDVLASTDAALDYLQKLHAMFGDWYLALAAYNWGEGSVARAIAKNQKQGLPTDYLSLNMPNETRNYVPKLLAVKKLIANPGLYSVQLPSVQNHPYFVTVTTSRDIDVDLVAQLAGLSLTEFKALNPSYRSPVILGASQPQILLPFHHAERFQENLGRYSKPLSSWMALTVQNRERIETLSQRLGVSADVLREVNGIRKGMRLMAGSTILVPRGKAGGTDVSANVAETAQLSVEPDRPDTRKISVRARKGDTVLSIASRYKVSAAQVRSWNHLTSDALSAGKSLIVMVPLQPKAGASKSKGEAKHTGSRSTKPAKSSRTEKPARKR